MKKIILPKRKFWYGIGFLWLFMSFAFTGLKAQCSDIFNNIDDGSSFWFVSDGGIPLFDDGTCGTTYTIDPGTFVTGDLITFNVYEGSTYTFSTCGFSTFDSYIRIWEDNNAAGYPFLASNDDDFGCSANIFASTLTWTATFTGKIWLGVTEFLCDPSGKQDFGISMACVFGEPGCDDSLNDPELTACPSNITLCGPQNVFWTAPTATDADGCEDPVVTSTHNSGASFGVGTTPVTYTATDGEGGTDQCSFTVTINPLPMVDINQIDVPQWCQGVKILFAKVGNIADLAEPVTYFWTTGETTEEILVTENGTYSVEVMDGNGCVSTATTVVNENLAELLSAHTILVDDEMDMDASTVLSGGVGVLDADEVSIQNGSDITTFFVSALAAVDGSSNVNDWTVADSPLAFPPFIANPFNDTNDQVIAGTVTLSGSNYGNVTVKSGSTLNIGNGEMYMKSLTVQKGGTVNFNQSGILLIKQKMNIGMMCNINVDGPGVVVYVGDNASVGQGSTVAVDIYAPEGLDVGDSGAFMTTYMYGLFVSDELNSGDNVIWGWNLVCGEGGGVEPPVDSNCCTEGGNDGVGCDDAACEAQICADDSFCCDTAWDGICASAAIESCEVCGAEEPPVVSNCCTEGGNGGVGCDDAACEAQICAADSFCCDTAWDGICASAAAAECEVCDGGGTPTMQSAIGNQEQTIENRVDDFTVFPNPSDGVVNVGVQSYIGSAVDVTITNAMGQQVWFQHIEVLETARIAVDLSADRYPSGMYNMTLRVNDAILTKQIILSK